MSQPNSAAKLIPLTDSGQTIADPEADVRGRTVIDSNGQDVGEVDDLLVDEEENKVRFLRVGAGGFLGIGEKHFLVPVDAVAKVEPERVHLSQDRERLSAVPTYDPELADNDPEYYTNLYSWWGFPPFWGAGYAYPPYP